MFLCDSKGPFPAYAFVVNSDCVRINSKFEKATEANQIKKRKREDCLRVGEMKTGWYL